MALTKHQEPQTYTPAYNEQIIVFSSTQIAVTDFKYIIFIVIGATSYQFDMYQRPDGLLVYDLKDVVSNYVKTQIDFSSLNQVCTADSIEITVNVLEYYSGTQHTPMSITYNVFNGCLKTNDFKNYLSTNYYKPIGANYTDEKIFMNELFSDVNIDDLVTINTDVWLTFVKSLATAFEWAVYDDTNTLLGTNITAITGVLATDIIRVNFNPLEVALDIGVSMANGYRVEGRITAGGGGALATMVFPTVNDVCTYHKVYRLYFLKRNGAIGCKTFEKMSELKVDKKTNTVELNPTTITSSGGVYSYGKTSDAHSTIVVSTESTYIYTLNSDWVTEAQKVKLEELFDSPKVWLQDDTDGSYTAVTIKDTSYTFDKHVNEPLFNYTVNVIVNQTETRQRGL